mmetsp:Transcript_28451/g.40049  ORF Transcript_28451/g.40049 Transcript_28451/m.40049 type:complete len:106 (-) Transcript_28451:557-874(-)
MGTKKFMSFRPIHFDIFSNGCLSQSRKSLRASLGSNPIRLKVSLRRKSFAANVARRLSLACSGSGSGNGAIRLHLWVSPLDVQPSKQQYRLRFRLLVVVGVAAGT